MGAATPYPIRRALASAEQRRQQVSRQITVREAVQVLESTYSRNHSREGLWEGISSSGVALPTIKKKFANPRELEKETVRPVLRKPFRNTLP